MGGREVKLEEVGPESQALKVTPCLQPLPCAVCLEASDLCLTVGSEPLGKGPRLRHLKTEAR